MVDLNLGANEFTFVGHGTRISYLTQVPGPVHPGEEGGVLDYHGIEGNRTFRGGEINRQDSPLGILITVTLRLKGDAGGLTATVLVPHVSGVSLNNSVEFDTVLIKAASRGNLVSPGPELTYTLIHLKGTERELLEPATQEITAQ
jgi:hypothetical protein